MSLRAAALLLATTALLGSTPFHLELNDSFPEADAVLDEAPTEIWLEFSVAPDRERSSFSVRGPGGNVELGEVAAGDEPEVLEATVIGAMPPGVYTVSWVGAPEGDHTVRGRFAFTIHAQR